jgi:hypothetical protein
MTEQSADNDYGKENTYEGVNNVSAIAHATSTLSDLSEQSFHDIVNADVRGTLDSETSKMLRQPENVARWHDTLLDMKRSVEAQLTAKKGELIAQRAEFMALGERGKPLLANAAAAAEKWRQGAIRFKNGVEAKIAEAKHLLSGPARDQYIRRLVDERQEVMRSNVKLLTAITQHRAAVENGEEGDEVDDHLWSVLDS